MRKQRRWGRPCALCLIVGSGLLLTGCGGSKATVTGKVTYMNAPVRGGTVTFIAKDGVPVSGEIKEDGTYKVDKVPTGPATITVETMSIRPAAKSGYRPPAPPKDAIPAGVDPSKIPGYVDPEKEKEKERRYVEIPVRYSDPKQSDLTFTVEKGPNEKNIDLAN